MRLGLFLCLILLWASLACSRQQVETPTPPDVSGLLKAYDAPSASLVQESIQGFVDELFRVDELHSSLAGLEPVFLLLDSLGGEETRRDALSLGEELEQQRQALLVGGQEIEGDGYMELIRTCKGWTEGEADQETNGYVKLTVIFSDDGLDPVLWGEAHDCRYRFEGTNIRMDGKVTLHTGTLLQGNTDQVRVLVAFDGEADIGNQHLEASFDFRLSLADNRLEYRLSFQGGNIVFFAGGNDQGFVAANGTWSCNFEEGTCEHNGKTLEFY